jgi:hypothetical protein
VAFVALASIVPSVYGSTPAKAQGPDPLYVVQNLLDVFQGPFAPATKIVNDQYANPYFLPDWDHNGIYGDAGDVKSEQSGGPEAGAFLYPCVYDDGSVRYETTTGTCAVPGTPGVVFRRGMAQRFKVVDAHGLALTAVLWLPDIALKPGAHGLPGLVFANGAFVAQRSYYMYDMAAARAGFVVLSYDSQGQGTSEGHFPQWSNQAPASGPCTFTSMSCRELQEMVRWFTGAPVAAESPHLGTHNPAYQPAGDNPTNPALGVVDLSRVAIAGQSMGSISSSNYLYWLAKGHDADGRSLPPVTAAILLSGFGPASDVVPVQAQTADLDIPGVTATNGPFAASDGPIGIKAWYEQLRASRQGTGMLQMLIQEGGSHGDTSDIPGAPHATWAWAWSTDYFTEFLACHVSHDPGACGRVIAPRAHLSPAYASEYDPDGAAGPSPSRCMNIPTKPSLEQAFDVTNPTHLAAGLLGQPPYTCTR